MNDNLRNKLEELARKDNDPDEHPDKFESAGDSPKNLDKQSKVDKFEKSSEKEKTANKFEQKKDMKIEEKNIESQLKESETRYQEIEEQYKRLLADYRNLSSRVAKEKEEIYKYAGIGTIEKILPALDNFDFALKSINRNTSADEIKKSIELLKDQLLNCLIMCGVEQIDTKNKFDARFHEALSKINDPEKDEGTILEVVKEGYKISDRVIRPALVIVSSKE